MNVYLNCDYGTLDSLIEYKTNLAELSNFLNEENYDDVLIVGDMNCDPFKGRFFREMKDFVSSHTLSISDVDQLPVDSYTYISQNSRASTSWLDHVISSNPRLVEDVMIHYGSALDDHIPISFNLEIFEPVLLSHSIQYEPKIDIKKVDWDRVSDEQFKEYHDILENISLDVWSEVLACDVLNCRSVLHEEALANIYETIVDSVICSSSHFPLKNSCSKIKIVPGWNQYCKEFHAVAREAFMAWHNAGRIRSGYIFENMKSTRRDFKKALKFCKNNKLKIQKSNLLSKFKIRNKNSFWTEVRRVQGHGNVLPSCIDNASNPRDIVKVFDEKFSKVLDDPRSQTIPGNQTRMDYNENFSCNGFEISNVAISQCIDKLNLGMGHDMVHTNHLKYCGNTFRNLLSKFLSKCVSHNFLPHNMLKGEIKPRIKDNIASKTSSDNYRPVMNSSNLFKLFEYCLLPHLEKCLDLCPSQFGFRKNTSCISAICILKETIASYNAKNSNVHCAMVDLSKAFDKININILMEKLKKTEMSTDVVNVIEFMFRNTFVNTKFNNFQGNEWKTGNGTRQGGILSAHIFSFYLNNLISQVNDLQVGCFLDSQKMNILCYADDIVLLAPSSNALQTILNETYRILEDLCLKVNVAKCSYIVFARSPRTKIATKLFLNGIELERVKSCKYLGVNFNENLSCEEDVDRVINSFLRQFNSLYSKFYFLDLNTLSYLFKSYTSSFYGIESWYLKLKAKSLNKISVAYHKAVKKIAGLNVWDSNHTGCEIAQVPIFRHLFAKRLVKNFFSICESKSPCLQRFNYYFRYKSVMNVELSKYFAKNYEISNLMLNPLCAISSRIDFVQRNEPRSSYSL